MAQRKYDILLRAEIEIGGVYEADSAALAIETATRELRTGGDVSNLSVERAIFLDEDDADAPEPVFPPELPL